MKATALDNLPDVMDKLPDNRYKTKKGSLCIANWFGDCSFYIFEAEEVPPEDFQRSPEYGKFCCVMDNNDIGFIEGAYYWRVLR